MVCSLLRGGIGYEIVTFKLTGFGYKILSYNLRVFRYVYYTLYNDSLVGVVISALHVCS